MQNIKVLAMILAIVILSGCSRLQVQPWVKAYERENLAKPIMQLSRTPLAEGFREHVYSVRGASRGATGGQGGGCGCN